jgi:hypothetical protein
MVKNNIYDITNNFFRMQDKIFLNNAFQLPTCVPTHPFRLPSQAHQVRVHYIYFTAKKQKQTCQHILLLYGINFCQALLRLLSRAL